MNIQRFAEQTGLSAHTLRYYEKINLLHAVRRNASGHRSYSANDLEWVAFIVRLKETGMPLQKIREYAQLREQGAVSMVQRQQMLVDHRCQLLEHIRTQQQHLQALDQKLDYYANPANYL